MQNKTNNSSGFVGYIGAAAFAILWSIIANQVDWSSPNKVYTWPITLLLIIAILGYGITHFISSRYPALQTRLQNIFAYVFLHRRWIHPFRKTRVLVIGLDNHEPTDRIVDLLSSCQKLIVNRKWLPSDVPEGKYDVVVIASIMYEWWAEYPRNEWETRLISFVREGGGLLAIHDSMAFWLFDGRFERYNGQIKQNKSVTENLLGLEPRMQCCVGWLTSNPDGSLPDGPIKPLMYGAPQRLPIRIEDPLAEPLIWLEEFAIDDEVNPYNIVPEVKCFLTTVIRDTEPTPPPMWNNEFMVSGGMDVGRGRTAFCGLGHNMKTYESQSYRMHIMNLVRWCGSKSKGQNLT